MGVGTILGGLAAALTVAGFASWWGMVQRVELGERRWIVNAMLLAGSAVAVLALFQQPGALAGSLAGVSLFSGVLYTALLMLAGQSKQAPAIAVGAPLPEFIAPDENAAPFAIADLRGHPVLIKFFRGHW